MFMIKILISFIRQDSIRLNVGWVLFEGQFLNAKMIGEVLKLLINVGQYDSKTNPKNL